MAPASRQPTQIPFGPALNGNGADDVFALGHTMASWRITQTELAEQTGVSRPHITNVLLRKNAPSGKMIQRLEAGVRALVAKRGRVTAARS